MDNSSHNDRMEQAIADLKSQDTPNYRATAKKYDVNHTTLRRRHLGEQGTRQAAVSEHRQRLTLAQEEVLVGHINKLTDRGIPPTPAIVRNLAEEIIQDRVGKNWTAGFIKRHQPKLKSLYLHTIDNQRVKADYAPLIKQFYDLVWIYCGVYNIHFC